MRLIFTKRAGKNDELAVVRDDGRVERISCPKQGMIPHDMVHYAVESVMTSRGFLSRIDRGEALAFAMSRDEVAESVERMVETIQAEVWSGRVGEQEIIDLYETGCAVRGHPAVAVTAEDVQRIRAVMEDLTRRWDAVPLNGELELTFDAHA